MFNLYFKTFSFKILFDLINFFYKITTSPSFLPIFPLYTGVLVLVLWANLRLVKLTPDLVSPTHGHAQA